MSPISAVWDIPWPTCNCGASWLSNPSTTGAKRSLLLSSAEIVMAARILSSLQGKKTYRGKGKQPALSASGQDVCFPFHLSCLLISRSPFNRNIARSFIWWNANLQKSTHSGGSSPTSKQQGHSHMKRLARLWKRHTDSYEFLYFFHSSFLPNIAQGRELLSTNINYMACLIQVHSK